MLGCSFARGGKNLLDVHLTCDGSLFGRFMLALASRNRSKLAQCSFLSGHRPSGPRQRDPAAGSASVWNKRLFSKITSLEQWQAGLVKWSIDTEGCHEISPRPLRQYRSQPMPSLRVRRENSVRSKLEFVPVFFGIHGVTFHRI